MRRSVRIVSMVFTGALGVGLAVIVGVAVAKSFVLQVADGAKVTNAGTNMSVHEAIAVTPSGFAVYELSGDSKSHPKCTEAKGCFGVWPPVTVGAGKKLAKPSGIKGKLGTWHRDGFVQLTLAGHPLYHFAGDAQKRAATGQDIKSFGGTWHVATASDPTGGSMSPTPTSSTPTMSTPSSPPGW